ncbi:mitochondrial fission factor-like [Tubulanus polymorphus]|uniref:mitochondrial fission factor-like n=1 Tax=Tubulanus polymorphus TaxID=672921 RepID=UPI003DA5FFAC
MSDSSPFHHTDYPSDYDPLHTSNYDPSFTADISNKMRIPEKLSMNEGHVNGLSNATTTKTSENEERMRVIQNSARDMQVPERILLAGSDHHIGLKESSRDQMNLDFTGLSSYQYVGLETPPRILKLDDVNYPSLDDELADRSKDSSQFNHSLQNGFVNLDDSSHEEFIPRSVTPPLMPFTPGMTASDVLLGQGDDDNLLLKRHVLRLTRHVAHLQKENQKRSQRELVLYPLIVGYIFVQVARWFFSSRRY